MREPETGNSGSRPGSPGMKRLQRQTAMKEHQFSSPLPSRIWSTRDERTSDSSPPKLHNMKADTSQQAATVMKESNVASAKPKEYMAFKDRLRGPDDGEQYTRPRSTQNFRYDEQHGPARKEAVADLGELFRKESMQTSTGMVSSRNPLASEQFQKSANPSQQRPSSKRTESVDRIPNFGSPMRDSLERSVRGMESQKPMRSPAHEKGFVLERPVRGIDLARQMRSPSHEKGYGKSSPVHEKFNDVDWMSKFEKLNINQHKEAWSSSKEVEETSKDFILTKFFQTPTKATPPVFAYDAYIPDDEEISPPMAHSSLRTSAKNRGATRRQSHTDNEMQNQPSMTIDTSRIQRDHTSSTGRYDRASTSKGFVPGLVESRTDAYNTSTRPNDNRLSGDEKFNPSSRSQYEHKPRKSEQESSMPSSPSTGRVRGSSLAALEQQAHAKEKEAMLRSLRMAAAVDQEHFLRTLKDNDDAVQSSAPLNAERSRHVGGNNNAQQPSSNYSRHSSPSAARQSQRDHVRDNGAMEGIGDFRTQERDAIASDHETFQRSRTSQDSGSANSRNTSSVRRRRNISFDGSLLEVTPPSADSIEKLRSEELLRSTSTNSSRSTVLSEASSGLSRQSSGRSSVLSDENFSSTYSETNSAGSSIIQKLMMKAGSRNNSTSTTGSLPSSPRSRPLAPRPPAAERRSSVRTSSLAADSHTDIAQSTPESPRRTIAPSSPGGGRRHSLVSEDVPGSLSDVTSSGRGRVNAVTRKAATSSLDEEVSQNNPLRVHVRAEAKSGSPLVVSPKRNDIEPVFTAAATPERTVSTAPWSPASDDSGSDSSGIEQPSPVSVLYRNERTLFQEESRLGPLQQKLQELHERINKSKTDVSNQKKRNLERIKERAAIAAREQEALERELQVLLSNSPVVELKKPSRTEESHVQDFQVVTPSEKKLVTPPDQVITAPEDRMPLAKAFTPAITTRHEKLQRVPSVRRPPADFCTALDTFDLKSSKCAAAISTTGKSKLTYWDLVYVRDVLVASGFGRDNSVMTKWHSLSEPMDPCLFEKMEDFYKKGIEFSASQFLSRLASCQPDHVMMLEHIRTTSTTHQGAIESINRCHLFDVVNECIGRALAPYAGFSQPWMSFFTEPVVRPRPVGDMLLQEIWTDVCDTVGENGSMAMDKAQLRKSLEALVGSDLHKRTDLFRSQQVERAAARIGLELEKRIFEDLLGEVINFLESEMTPC